jgi:hypothetical protein
LSKKARMMGAEPGRPNEPSPITRIDTARVRAVQSAAGRSFIEPGSPWQNRFVESFGSRVRDEVLSVEAFDSVLEARTVITDWITIYNTGGHTAVSAGDCRRPMPLADHEQVGETGPALIAAGPTNGGRSGGGSGETAQCNHQECCRGAWDQIELA